MRQYLEKSWIHPGIERLESKIQGWGTIATQPIRAGEVVFIFGGTLVTDADVEAGKVLKNSYVNIDEGLHLGHLVESGLDLDDYLNHSCNPNVWMDDEVTLTAMIDIASNEEVAIDYAMYVAHDWVAAWDCNCGTPGCRGKITGNDWKLPAVQQRYRGHFSPFVENKINDFLRIGNSGN